jgi:Ca2+-binding EF-hand superfamily protein
LFGSHRTYKPLWRSLFTAIDLNADNVVDFEEFLTFVTHLKRGDVEARRQLCFRVFDTNRDGYAERGDLRCIAEARAACLRKDAWHQVPITNDAAEDEYTQFFNACDDSGSGRFSLEDFENYCQLHGEGIVNQTLKLLEPMFDGVIEETGIIITATDVRNTKPHIDWQDHKIGMGSFFCCSSAPPIFTTPPVS